MNMDSLNKWLMLAANIGVIAGIVFLAVEINQNNEALETQARLARTVTASNLLQLSAASPELATALAKSRREEELTPTELIQLAGYSAAVFRTILGQYQEINRGRLDEEEVVLSMIFTMQMNPSFIVNWELSKSRYPADYVEWFEENIINP